MYSHTWWSMRCSLGHLLLGMSFTVFCLFFVFVSLCEPNNGALLKLWQHRLCTQLPSIHLANLCSIGYKMYKYLLQNKTCSDALCFTETWLNESNLDSANSSGVFTFTVGPHYTAIREVQRWWDLILHQPWLVYNYHCANEIMQSKLELFYCLWEFSSIMLVGVYIPPHQHGAEYTDSVFIILGDFNRGFHKLAKYSQHFSCPTRHSNTLDHCYIILKGAYFCVSQVD